MRALVTLLSIFAVLLLAVESVHPSGQREDPIRTAEELIEEGRYNEAVGILQNVARDDPNRFDEAERLLQRVRRIRTRYNELWQHLIDTLRNEPENVEAANAIIEEMESLGDAPTEEALREFELWRDIVRLRFNLNRFEEISVRALELMEANEYPEAMQEYARGLGLFRAEFEHAEYPEEVVEQGTTAQAELARIAAESGSSFEAADEAVDRFIELFADREAEPSGIEPLIQQLVDSFGPLADSEFRTAGIGDYFRNLDSEVRRIREMNDPDPYLTFHRWFAYGRSANAGEEGMFAAVRRFTEERLDYIVERIDGTVDGLLAEGNVHLETEAFDNARATYETASRLLLLAAETFEVQDRREEARTQLAATVERAEIPNRDAERAAFRLVSEASAAIATLAEERGNLPALADAGAGLAALESAWITAGERFDDAREALGRYEEAFDRRAGGGERAERYFARLDPHVDTLYGDIASRAVDTAYAYLSAGNRQYASTYDSLARELSHAELIGIGGVPYDTPEQIPAEPDEPDDPDEIVYRYPDIAIERLQEVDSSLSQLADEVNAMIEAFADPREPIRESERVERERIELESLATRLGDLVTRNNTAMEEMGRRIAEAEMLRDDVRALLAEAEAILNDDPEAAGDLFSDAEDLLVDALELQQHTEFRDYVDAQLADAGDRIQASLFEATVGEVRELIDEGRRLYRQDNFGRAEQALLDAQERWNRVNETENSEIRYWLRLTQSALNLQTDRDLADTDPLYRPLGSYLNLAYSAFERAEEERARGNDERAEQLLARAEDNIQSVTVARPFNREARVLGLQIIELLNPNEFDTIFEERFNQAMQAMDETPFEALNDLYDLQEVEPDWPGLEQAIFNAEIAAGVREPPRDEASVERSNELEQQARAIFDPGDMSAIEEAVSLLEEAIQLNPDNDDARALLDEVRLAQGSTAAPTLSSSELQRFRRAENHFLDGQIGRALVIVEQLWQEEENRRYPPLADLRSRMVAQ